MIEYQYDNSIENYNYNCFIYDPCCEWQYHFHKNYELIYVMSGELNVCADGEEYVMNKGDFSLLLPNVVHRLSTPRSSRVWICVFSADFVSSFDAFINGRANRTPTFCVKDGVMMSLLERDLLNVEKKELFSMQSALFAVCDAYVRSAEFYARPQKRNLPAEMFEYTKTHFDEDVSLGTMAMTLGYNYQYMSRMYKKTFRINYRDFLNQFRLSRAQELLRDTGLSVTEVAMRSGFGSVRTMNRSFERAYGASPREIRNGKNKA